MAPPATLAFLNLGPSEIAILLILFLVLFGVDKAPEIARNLGRARSELDKAQREIRESLEGDDDRAIREQMEFEKQREAHIAAHGLPDRDKLVRAATDLGLQTDGLTDGELRDAIKAALGTSTPP